MSVAKISGLFPKIKPAHYRKWARIEEAGFKRHRSPTGSPSSGEGPPKNARSTGSRYVSGPLARAKAGMNAGLFGSYTEIGANS
jgi:hypothetical protein